MPRILRSNLPDGYFHVTARGVARTEIYRDDDDRRTFLELLAQTVARHRWVVHAFCLMGNHYHLVVETTRQELSAGVQRLSGRYAEQFNERWRRSGHVFGARFDARVIESDEYLQAACEYVLENPVRAGLCERAADWCWSGARRADAAKRRSGNVRSYR